ncbi:response regulator transcription factor [Angustibacter sp. McL0619]|uniref:response regulator transcription factor n=1 Tax=Angustibacter sp. McL0619 TaxID=3415676 RepID=UPI003CE72D85
MRLLVVDDEPAMASVLSRGLAENGYAVDVAADGTQALWLATENDYDVVVLDIGLPDLDGLEVLARLRASGRRVPILLLTAHDRIQDRVDGLDAGADDYLVKPFAFPELLARIRAMARRGPVARPSRLVVDDLELDPATRQVHRAGRQIVLTHKEFALLECLMRAPGQVLSRSYLIEHVWDVAFDRDSNVVDVYVGYLRAKVDKPFARQSLRTVRGAGYVIGGDGVQP